MAGKQLLLGQTKNAEQGNCWIEDPSQLGVKKGTRRRPQSGGRWASNRQRRTSCPVVEVRVPRGSWCVVHEELDLRGERCRKSNVGVGCC